MFVGNKALAWYKGSDQKYCSQERTMAFEGLHELNEQLDGLVTTAHNRPQPERKKLEHFVLRVLSLEEQAYDDVGKLLRKIASHPGTTMSSTEISFLKSDLMSTHSSEKFRDLLRICDALMQLSAEHIVEISAAIPDDKRLQFDQLFHLIQASEAQFKDTIRESLWAITFELGQSEASGDVGKAKETSLIALRDLERYQYEARQIAMKISGTVGGFSSLLDVGKVATSALQRSPWYSGSFFLGTVIILLIGLTVVVGKMPLKSFLLVVSGTYAGLVLIAAFTLFRDGNLTEVGLLQLVRLAMSHVAAPISRKPSTD